MLELIKYNEITYRLLRWWYSRQNKSVRSYVFVCSTGRCGTNTISDVFARTSTVASLHEPYPTMYSNGSDLSITHQKRLSLIKRKHLNILRASKEKLAYIESNHMFIKTFFNIAIDFLPIEKIKLIHVRREPFSVASSFYSINSIPGRPPTGDRFLLDPFGKDNMIDLSQELKSNEFSHDFYKCLWYWYEVEARIAKAKESTGEKISWLTLQTKELNSENKINELIEFVDLTEEITHIQELVGVRSNQKTNQKAAVSSVKLKAYETKFNQLLVEKGFSPYQEQ